MFELNKVSSRTTLKSTLIKSTWASGFLIFSLNFKHIIMAYYSAIETNQWLLDLFKIQTFTIRKEIP